MNIKYDWKVREHLGVPGVFKNIKKKNNFRKKDTIFIFK